MKETRTVTVGIVVLSRLSRSTTLLFSCYLLEGKEQNVFSYNRERFLFEKRISYLLDILSSTQVPPKLVHFERGIDMQRLPGLSTRRIMGSNVFFGASTETAARSAG